MNEQGNEDIDCHVEGLLDEYQGEIIVSICEIRPSHAIKVGSLLCDSELADCAYLHESNIEHFIIDVPITEDVPIIVFDRFRHDITVLVIHLIEEANDYCGVVLKVLVIIHVILGLQDGVAAGTYLY